ncbi:MAG: DmsC/YnfH family molybdoenzyme membrane anchor subunit [Gemmatimonadota bacterium]
MTYGPRPWQQTQWDWRAAGNFICGGAGSGLIVFTAVSGARGPVLTALMLAGLALIGLGLTCVWLEIGRPLRAFNVFFNPRTSWMSREAIAATLLMPVGFASAVAVPELAWLAALIALVFVYCQSRMLQASKGIVAWREPSLLPLMMTTGLTEGAGLFWLGALWHGQATLALLLLFAALVLVRMLLWRAWRRRLERRAAPRALGAIDGAGRTLLIAGTLIPLGASAVAGAGQFGASATMLAAVAGLLATIAGSWFKFTLVTRAGFNQGFALTHLPIRGARR